MKLLLVICSEEAFEYISGCAKALGYELIRYTHVIKAMDNIDEIDPAAIIISAKDFPRHWKTMVQFVRSERSKESCPIILLKGEHFPTEEASKASSLGVNGIIDESFNNPDEINFGDISIGDISIGDISIGDISILKAILRGEKPALSMRKKKCICVEPGHRIAFVFSRPKDEILVTGEVKAASTEGIYFMSDNAELMNGIAVNTELGECSLRAGDSILSPLCRLAEAGSGTFIEFISFTEGEKEIYSSYIKSLLNKG